MIHGCLKRGTSAAVSRRGVVPRPPRAWLSLIVVASCLGGWAGRAQALPIVGAVVNDPRCDPVNDRLVEELGLHIAYGGPFPEHEGIYFSATATDQYVCVSDDGVANDWLVFITNLTGKSYGDGAGRPLYFVANTGNTIGNSDGQADWSVPSIPVPAGGLADAFRINSTGVNDNLIYESFAPDQIFAPGETWGFLVTNFVTVGGGALAPSFLSLGHSVGNTVSTLGTGTASIVVGVPEPSTWAMMALAGLGLGGMARSRRRTARG